MGASAECCSERISPLSIMETEKEPTKSTLLVVNEKHAAQKKHQKSYASHIVLMSLKYKDMDRSSILSGVLPKRQERLLKATARIFTV